jgi:two-component system heavy metal sensor histidine kinase CusS
MSSKSAAETTAGARPPARAWSLTARLTFWYAASAFALVLGATGFLYWALVSHFDREDDALLADQVRIVRGLLRDRPEGLARLGEELRFESPTRRFEPVLLRIVDGRGRVLVESSPPIDLPLSAFPEAAGLDRDPGPALDLRDQSGRPLRVLAARVSWAGDPGGSFFVQAAMDETQELRLLARYRRQLLSALAIALLVSAAVGHRIATRGLRPVREISRTAGRVRRSTLSERIETSRLPRELLELARTFNGMLERLEDSFRRLSRFSADLAHELRNPVGNLRGELEVALGQARPAGEYRDVLESSLEECARLSRIIDQLLFLARAESPDIFIRRERTDVGRELEVVREFYDAAASEKGIALRVVAPGPAVAAVDRGLLQQAVGNLISNALAHTPAGGSVTLSAAAADGGVTILVSDTGRGIPPEHVARVFDRLYRVDPARSASSGGAGLGLAIVQSILALHRGWARLESRVGEGTRVTLWLPAQDLLGEPPPALGLEPRPTAAQAHMTKP